MRNSWVWIEVDAMLLLAMVLEGAVAVVVVVQKRRWVVDSCGCHGTTQTKTNAKVHKSKYPLTYRGTKVSCV